MSETLDLLRKARWQAAKQLPYLARGLWAMTFVECDAVPTCGVDEHWRVYFNPTYAEKCAKDKTLIGEVLHECLHPTMRHKRRGETIHAEHGAWNAAGDKEIDQRILAAGVTLVTDRVECPAGCETWTAEEHYHAQGDSKPHAGGQGGKPMPGGQGAGGGSGARGDKGARGACAGGSGVDGVKRPWEQGAPDGANAPGLTEAEGEVVRVQVAAAIRAHVETKGRGSVPAGLQRWADEYGVAPPVDWRALVSARVRYALDAKRGPAPSYARPSRRNVGGGLVLPVHRLPVADIAVVIDTSGSMGDDDIGDALGVVVDACAVLGRVKVVSCDADAGDAVEVREVEDLRPYLVGGGGTDMCVGIARAVESGADAVVVVTDGYTPWPGVAPDAPVVVVDTTGNAHPPEWAEVVRVERARK